MRSSVTLSRRECLALLAPLAAPAFVREARAAEVPRFALGVASGLPQPDRLVLWTRLTGEDLPEQAEVRWELAHDEAFTRIAARGSESAEAAWAHSVHAEPAGLAPGRWYWYRFEALGQRSAAGRTRTAPAADAAAPLRFAIASCQRWDHGHYAAWRHLAEDAPDLVLFLGDYIYEYPSPPGVPRAHDGGKLRTLAQFRERYAQYKSDPLLQQAHAACPWLVTRDDHEVENDHARDRSPTLLGADFLQLRAAAFQAAWEHQPYPKAWRPRGAAMPIHLRCDWGRLARIHLLDERQFRDPQVCLPPGRTGGAGTVEAAACPALHDPQRSLLGAEQERWLAEGWDPRRRWNLLAQQTLMARASSKPTSAADPDGPEQGRYRTDGWDGYAATRERVLQALAARRVPNTVVLGGDVHAHMVADLHLDFDRPAAQPLATEFVGTSISSRGAPASHLRQLLANNPHLRHARSDERGYIGFTLAEHRLDARLWAVDRPLDPASPLHLQARFTVEDGEPGAQRA